MPPLLEVHNLSKNYLLPNGHILKAVERVSFNLNAGETLGLLGESGCGKTTLMRCLLGIEELSEGEVLFKGKKMSDFQKADYLQFRREVQMIFQNISGSLNPRMTIGESIAEPLSIHKIVAKESLSKEVFHLLDLVGLSKHCYQKYPHELSGGQKQRAAIARALALKPNLIVCDEPVSALDVSIQAQIINLLKELQKECLLTYLFITHDVPLIKYMSDRVAVMSQGQILKVVETELLIIY